MVLDRSLWMDETALIRDCTIGTDENVFRDRLTEHLDFEDVRDDLLRFAIDVGVDERDVVITRDHVSESGEPFFDALEGDGIRERVAQVLELLVGRC